MLTIKCFVDAYIPSWKLIGQRYEVSTHTFDRVMSTQDNGIQAFVNYSRSQHKVNDCMLRSGGTMRFRRSIKHRYRRALVFASPYYLSNNNGSEGYAGLGK